MVRVLSSAPRARVDDDTPSIPPSPELERCSLVPPVLPRAQWARVPSKPPRPPPSLSWTAFSSSLMPPDLYMFLVDGNRDKLSNCGIGWTMWKLLSTEDGSNVLHIAAEAGQRDLITDFLLPGCKDLSTRKNSKGDLPVHSAVKAGHLGALKALTTWLNDPQSDTDRIGKGMLGMGNQEGDTPLHIAVENNELNLAVHLMNIYGEACYQLNGKQVCPLYMAIKAGHWQLVDRMVSFTKEHINPASMDALIGGKSIVHAAIEANNLEILKTIMKDHRNLIGSFDEGDRTPLSYAAFKGYHEVVSYLVTEFPVCAYICDKDGSFPIHSAASGGHINVINKLHHTRRLLNRKKQNILHVAAANGSSEVVAYLLKNKEFENLTNSKDEDGNTPLHLASKGLHPRVVYILTWRRRKVKQIELQNKDGLTALDVLEIHGWPSPSFEARLTWMALRYIDAPRSSRTTKQSYKNEKASLDEYKDMINTHLILATLVATVTFAAGFTLPGGYNQDDNDPQIGMAVLAWKRAFQVYVIFDTIAMYSSILSVVILIWAQMGDLKLIDLSLKFAIPLLGFSLSMMSLAFMTGVFVVLRIKLWLSYMVLGIGCLFLVVVLVIFIPLYNPSYIRNSVVRFIFSGSFLLLLRVSDITNVYG